MFFKFLVLYITQQLHVEQIINLSEYLIWMAIHEVCILLRTFFKINIQLHTILSEINTHAQIHFFLQIKVYQNAANKTFMTH